MPDLPKSYFTFSNRVENLLFEGVSACSNGGILGLCFAVAAFTFLYEGVKAFRHYFVILQMRHKDDPHASFSESNSSDQKSSLFKWLNPTPLKTFEKLKFHFVQTLLHMLQLTMGYMVMLIVMSYNAWFLITVIATSAMCFYIHEFVLSRRAMILPVEIPGTNL